jgi:hypothetical protein
VLDSRCAAPIGHRPNLARALVFARRWAVATPKSSRPWRRCGVHRRVATAGVCVVPSHRVTACHCPTAQNDARVPDRLRLSECLGGDRRREGSPSSWRPPSRRYSAPCPILTGPARSSSPAIVQEDRVGGAYPVGSRGDARHSFRCAKNNIMSH